MRSAMALSLRARPSAATASTRALEPQSHTLQETGATLPHERMGRSGLGWMALRLFWPDRLAIGMSEVNVKWRVKGLV